MLKKILYNKKIIDINCNYFSKKINYSFVKLINEMIGRIIIKSIVIAWS